MSYVLAALVCSVFLSFPLPSEARTHQSEPTMREDAELWDVFFLDSDRGWAVGDRGVIWATNDGGRHWRLQDSGVDAELTAVFMASDHHGWAVGGWTYPYTHRSQAILLRTTNGGHSWQPVELPYLSRLVAVHFDDPKHGWAIGEGTLLFPSGAVHSQDGGRSWQAVPGPFQAGWTAADRWTGRQSVLVNAEGQAAVLYNHRVVPAEMPTIDGGPARDIAMTEDGRGWMVGDGGRVLQTRDGGRTWQEPPRAPAGDDSFRFDFNAVAVHGDHCWISGVPGTIVFHSADGGNSWNAYQTGQSLPLRAMTFLDTHRGWAVGALGTILSTRDGGQTWRVQRRGGRRVAVLGLFSDPEEVPFELLSLVAGEEGYLSAVEIINRRGVEVRREQEATSERRVREAVIGCGASSAAMWHAFPLRQRGLELTEAALLAPWGDSETEARARLVEALVQRIRQWRPDMIVTQSATVHGDRSLGHLINQSVLTAVRKAADESALVQLQEELHLEPWTVRRVVGMSPDQAGTIRIASTQLAPRLNGSLAEHAALPRALVFPRFTSRPDTLRARIQLDRVAPGGDRRTLLSGLNLSPGSDARRIRSAGSNLQLQDLSAQMQRRRNLRQIISHTANSSRSAAWLAQIDQLTFGMPQEEAGELLFELGRHYALSHQWDLAAEALEALVQRSPDHLLSDYAALWLIQYLSSSEAHRHQGSVAVVQAVHGAKENGEADGFPGLSLGPDPSLIDDFEYQVSRGTGGDRRRRWQRLVDLEQTLRRSNIGLAMLPGVRFSLAAAHRQLGQHDDAQRALSLLDSLEPESAWSAASRSEPWLQDGQGQPPKPVYRLQHAAQRPRLDASLDDKVWQQAEPIELRSAFFDDSAWPAHVMLACDEQFLYIAAHCKKAPSADYPQATETRPQNADLSQRDRVEILIDVDRDYASYFKLAFDHRGWTLQSCWNDPGWNPTYYVAANQDEHSWTIEVAIPWEELTTDAISASRAWAIGVQRVVPQVGFQSWNRPATVDGCPQGFGLLLFPGSLGNLQVDGRRP